jgi:hypothetical protein
MPFQCLYLRIFLFPTHKHPLLMAHHLHQRTQRLDETLRWLYIIRPRFQWNHLLFLIT